jgi:phosphatidylglycerophosphate synthase
VKLSNVIIAADESANWRIAGLRQLDRLALAINELVEANGLIVIPSAVEESLTVNNERCLDSARHDRKIDIFVFWKPTIAAEQRWIPHDPRLTRCQLRLDHQGDQVMPVLSTRLLLKRGGLAEFISTAPELEPNKAIVDLNERWTNVHRTFVEHCRDAQPGGRRTSWRCLSASDELVAAERWFLRDSGKPQDGFVSRFINRPISRLISRALLKSRLTPGAWTLSIFVLPIVAFVLLQRGDYIGFVAGAVLFQLFSILDGCDGEVARAKYLESERGRALDTFFDVAGNVLFALGLGVGLQRLHHGWYVAEGILCAAALATNEWLLMDSKTEKVASSDTLGPAFYHRHRTMLRRAGLLFVGEKFLWWIFQLTKRDVAIFFFLLLAIAGRAEWILHLWTVVAGAGLIASLIARLRVP